MCTTFISDVTAKERMVSLTGFSVLCAFFVVLYSVHEKYYVRLFNRTFAFGCHTQSSIRNSNGNIFGAVIYKYISW